MNYWDWQVNLTPTGCQTLSKMPSRYINGVYPKLLSNGKGCRVYDLEGKEYIDLISGLGAVSVGYANEEINKVIREQLERGVSFSLPNLLEGRVADRLNNVVHFTQQWKFSKTGTEACLGAVRAAKAYTGRDKVMTAGYHGWSDTFECLGTRNAGIHEFNSLFIKKAVYNDINSFADVQSKKYACVIIEPYVFDMPNEGFLEYLRDLCTSTGTLLIFDEVVTGGRTEGFVAANLFNVEPDLIILGKALANGLPLAAIGGKKSLMSVFERDDFFMSGTYGGECLSLAACLETIDILEKQMSTTTVNGYLIKTMFNRLFSREGVVCKGYPTRLTFDFLTKEHKALFMQEMCFSGVLVGYSNMVMADTTYKDVEKILTAIRVAYSVLIDNWDFPLGALRGSVPVETLRLR